jgi:NTP pyrophosphatase (non-canonical NTP hydrolase)
MSNKFTEEAKRLCQLTPYAEIEADHSNMVDRLMKDPASILESLTPEKVNLIHIAFQIAGEACELLDAVKKHVIYNRPIDMENVVEEMGDLEFSLSALRSHTGISRATALMHNKLKLTGPEGRFPNGYSDAAANARADKAPAFVQGANLVPEHLVDPLVAAYKKAFPDPAAVNPPVLGNPWSANMVHFKDFKVPQAEVAPLPSSKPPRIGEPVFVHDPLPSYRNPFKKGDPPPRPPRPTNAPDPLDHPDE